MSRFFFGSNLRSVLIAFSYFYVPLGLGRARARTFGLITFSLGRSPPPPPPPPPAVEVFCLIRLQANLIKTRLRGGRWEGLGFLMQVEVGTVHILIMRTRTCSLQRMPKNRL